MGHIVFLNNFCLCFKFWLSSFKRINFINFTLQVSLLDDITKKKKLILGWWENFLLLKHSLFRRILSTFSFLFTNLFPLFFCLNIIFMFFFSFLKFFSKMLQNLGALFISLVLAHNWSVRPAVILSWFSFFFHTEVFFWWRMLNSHWPSYHLWWWRIWTNRLLGPWLNWSLFGHFFFFHWRYMFFMRLFVFERHKLLGASCLESWWSSYAVNIIMFSSTFLWRTLDNFFWLCLFHWFLQIILNWSFKTSFSSNCSLARRIICTWCQLLDSLFWLQLITRNFLNWCFLFNYFTRSCLSWESIEVLLNLTFFLFCSFLMNGRIFSDWRDRFVLLCFLKTWLLFWRLFGAFLVFNFVFESCILHGSYFRFLRNLLFWWRPYVELCLTLKMLNLSLKLAHLCHIWYLLLKSSNLTLVVSGCCHRWHCVLRKLVSLVHLWNPSCHRILLEHHWHLHLMLRHHLKMKFFLLNLFLLPLIFRRNHSRIGLLKILLRHSRVIILIITLQRKVWSGSFLEKLVSCNFGAVSLSGVHQYILLENIPRNLIWN